MSSPREHLVRLAGTAGALAVRAGDVEIEVQRQAEQICAKMEGHKSTDGIRSGVSGLSASCGALALALSLFKSVVENYVSLRFEGISSSETPLLAAETERFEHIAKQFSSDKAAIIVQVPSSGIAPASDKQIFISDFNRVSAIIKAEISQDIDGKTAILEMKAADGQWRQMEWIGWFFEHIVENKVLEAVGGTVGPTYGNTTIDLMLSSPWDLKAHPLDKEAAILNDIEAINACIEQYGRFNFFLLEGNATYDDDKQSFKRWHDDLKGEPSAYVKSGNAIGRRSRVRKTSFQPTRMIGICLDAKTLQHGISSGAIKRFQDGMKNSNGNKRRGKYQIVPNKIDDKFLTISIDLAHDGEAG